MCCNTDHVTSYNNATVAYNTLHIREVLLNYETNERIEEAVNCRLIPILYFIGAPANILTMIIFYRQGLRDRMSLCLFCLAFIDLLQGTSTLFGVSYCFISIYMPGEEQLWKILMMKHTSNFVYAFTYSSGCVTMIIAVERCVCVMFPMKAATLISTKTMAIIISGTLLVIQVLCGVYILKDRLSPSYDRVGGRYLIILTELYTSNSIFRIIENIFLPVISTATFAVVLLATVATVIKLQIALTWRKLTASGSSYLKGQSVLMKTLVMVSCLYILCAAPNVSLALTRFAVSEFRADGLYGNLFYATHIVGLAIAMLNSSINFFVYVTMSSRFRRELQTIFLCRK